MPVRLALPAFAAALLTSAFAITAGVRTADATSTSAASPPAAPGACRVRARFVEAIVAPPAERATAGSVTVQWRYAPAAEDGNDAPGKNCADLAREFSVWIPGGSFSTLSRSIVYPGHLTEPKPGELYRLELVRLARPRPGWFFSGTSPRPEGKAR